MCVCVPASVCGCASACLRVQGSGPSGRVFPPLKLPLFTWHAAGKAGTDGVKHTHTHTHTLAGRGGKGKEKKKKNFGQLSGLEACLRSVWRWLMNPVFLQLQACAFTVQR